jgi:chromosome segregation ATPase
MVPKANVDAMKKGHEQKLAAEVKKRHDESTSYEELVTSLRQRLEEAKSKPAEPDKFAELNKKLEDAYSQRDKANNLVGNYKSQLELADSDVKRIRKEKTELKTQFDTLEAKLAEKDKMLADEKQKREEAEKAAKVPPQVPVVQKPVQQPKGKPKIPKFFVEMPKDEKPAEEEQKEKPEIPKFFIDMP